MAHNWIHRHGQPKHFSYSLKNQPVTDKSTLTYIRSLRIPPAWQEVQIAQCQRSKILAKGKDKAGRLQAIYHPGFRARQDKAKFERVLRFARALPAMRKATAQHLQHKQLDKQKVLATIVQIMDQTYMRVGNENYAKENQHYGLTTLRSKHATIKGDTVIFDFVGKSGQINHKKVKDRQLARIVKRLDELPGYEIFRYQDENGAMHDISSSDVNAYIKEIMGEEFSAKDFRTWAGTLTAAGALAAHERASTVKERKKAITDCVRQVAKRLGNTPAIARSSYIDPKIFSLYLAGDEISKVYKTVKQLRASHEMNPDEHYVLKLLES